MENHKSNNYNNTIDQSSAEQLRYTSKWSTFNGVVYSLLAITVLLTCVLFFFNFDEIIKVMSKLNGMSDEMLGIMRNGGKMALIVFCVVCFSVLFYNGFLLLKFGSNTAANIIQSKESLRHAFQYLNKYFKLSIILSIISLGFSALATLMILFAG